MSLEYSPFQVFRQAIYHIPIPSYELKVTEDREKERVAVGIDTISTGYYIPFTKENIDRLSKHVT